MIANIAGSSSGHTSTVAGRQLLDALFQFLFKYRPAVFQHGELAFGSPASVIVLLLIAAAIGVPAILTYGGVRGRSRPRDRWVLGALRSASIVLLLVCLFRPMLLLSAAVPQRNYVGVLIDDSRSMQIPDDGGRPRGDFVKQQLGGAQAPLLRALQSRFIVRLFRFSSSAQRIASPDDVTFTGAQTRVGDAVERAREELQSVPLSGLVVLTDGADNSRAPFAEELLSLRARTVPVFAVGLGSERFARDIEIRRVSTPHSVLKGASLTADVLVEQRGFAGATVPLVVEDEGRVVDRENIKLPPDGEVAPVRLHVAATGAGPHTYTFRIPVQPGELVTQNNARQALVIVRDRREKILYVDGLRVETAFIRRAIADDSSLQVAVLPRTAENKFLRLDVDGPEDLASGFPKTRNELFQYRAVILGSIEASFFTHDQLAMLADFVSVRGGGLLFLGGRQAFAEGGYAGTPVADVMPVVVEGNAVPDSLTFLADLSVRVTPLGASEAVTQIAPGDRASVARWGTLPAVTSVNRILRLKPGAVALVTGTVPAGGRSSVPGGQRIAGYEQPVLAYQHVGRGIAVALTIQDSWTWKMAADIPVGDLTFQTFWRQLLRWLTAGTPDRVVATVSADEVNPNEPVTIRAEVTDSGYAGINDARVVAHVVFPSGVVHDVPMEWTVERDGEYRATLTPPAGEEGQYAVRVDAVTGPVTSSSDSVYFRAAALPTEFFDAEMRGSLLRRIATETGGKFYTPATVGTLPEDIALSKRGVTVVNQMELWDMPAVFLALVALVSAEWAYRKTRGLV